MSTTRTILMAIVLAICLPMAALSVQNTAGGNQRRSFTLPQHGTLVLVVPNNWKQNVRQPPGDLPPTITFTPEKGDDFEVLITPLWNPRKDSAFNKPDKVKALIGDELQGMLPGAVEQRVDIQEFNGLYGTGYYFMVTDKAPKAGEYPHALRAGVGVGDLLLSVTVLSRSKNSIGNTATIKGLQDARQVY